MKPVIMTSMLLLTMGGSFAQTNQNFDRSGSIPWLMQDDMTARVQAFVSDNKVLIGKDKNIEGSVFLDDKWNKGYIKLTDNKIATNLFLRYNVYADKLYFLRDMVELVLQNQVAEFGYEYSNDAGVVFRNCFRNRYPAIDNNTGASFYELIMNGNITLLKKHQKLVKQKLQTTGDIIYKIEDVPSWYAYSASKNKMVKIKKDPHSLSGLFDPQSLKRLNEIIQSNNIRLTNEKKIIGFFEILYREGI